MSLASRLLSKLRRRRTIGERGEDLAAAHLKKLGYRILARNVRSRIGEIDIVAEAPDGRTIVIVEVKASAGPAGDFTPEMHVNKQKQRKLKSLAVALVRRHKLADRPLRFDVIAVEDVAGTPVVRHHAGAFVW